MDMVRRGVMDRRRLASCCRVDVMKGGAGVRCFSPRLTEVTVKGASFVSSRIAFTSARHLSSRFFSPSP